MALSRPPIELYEGNFNEWRKTIEDILTHKNFSFTINEESNHSQSTDDSSPQAVGVISRHVRPDLLERIPPQERKNPHHLLARLKKTAKPFPFLALAPELRNRIYDILLDERHLNGHVLKVASIDLAREGKGIRRRHQLPPITQASHQFRGETRAMFFERTSFSFTFPSVDYWGLKLPLRSQMDLLGRLVMEELSSWTREVVGENVKDLRSVQIQHSWRYGRLMLDETDGLKLKTSFRQYTETRLKKRIERANASRVEGAMDGNEIIDVLLGDPTIWAEDLSMR